MNEEDDEIGIWLPATVSRVEGKELVEWRTCAEPAKFASLGVIDRLGYRVWLLASAVELAA